MTLQQLAYFLAAAEAGSFSAAAEELHMAQPSLSEQIRRLEAELGVPLFARAGRGLVLTEAGRALRPRPEATLVAAREAGGSVPEVRGRGDAVSAGSLKPARGSAGGLPGVAYAPPLYETFAFITRRDAHLSP